MELYVYYWAATNEFRKVLRGRLLLCEKLSYKAINVLDATTKECLISVDDAANITNNGKMLSVDCDDPIRGLSWLELILLSRMSVSSAKTTKRSEYKVSATMQHRIHLIALYLWRVLLNI